MNTQESTNLQNENNIREWDYTTDPTIKKLRRELLATRIFSMISSLLMLGILVGGFLVCITVKGYVDEAWPLVEQLSEVDFQSFNQTMEKLDDSLNAVNWEEMSQQLAALDMEALNEAVEGMDTEELSKALENLNDAVDSLKSLGESMKNFAAKFGF